MINKKLKKNLPRGFKLLSLFKNQGPEVEVSKH